MSEAQHSWRSNGQFDLNVETGQTVSAGNRYMDSIFEFKDKIPSDVYKQLSDVVALSEKLYKKDRLYDITFVFTSQIISGHAYFDSDEDMTFNSAFCGSQTIRRKIIKVIERNDCSTFDNIIYGSVLPQEQLELMIKRMEKKNAAQFPHALYQDSGPYNYQDGVTGNVDKMFHTMMVLELKPQ